MDTATYAGRVLQRRIDSIDEVLAAPPDETCVLEGVIVPPEGREILASERVALVACIDSFDRRTE